jgi:hypothetical protein
VGAVWQNWVCFYDVWSLEEVAKAQAKRAFGAIAGVFSKAAVFVACFCITALVGGREKGTVKRKYLLQVPFGIRKSAATLAPNRSLRHNTFVNTFSSAFFISAVVEGGGEGPVGAGALPAAAV